MSRMVPTVVRAPAFQRLVHAVANSHLASDDFKKDPIVECVLQPGWRPSTEFPIQDPALLATTFAALIREYSIPGLAQHLHTLTTLGHVASAFVGAAATRNDDTFQNPRIVEVQELSAVCQALCGATEVTWAAEFVSGPTLNSHYVQFVAE